MNSLLSIKFIPCASIRLFLHNLSRPLSHSFAIALNYFFHLKEFYRPPQTSPTPLQQATSKIVLVPFHTYSPHSPHPGGRCLLAGVTSKVAQFPSVYIYSVPRNIGLIRQASPVSQLHITISLYFASITVKRPPLR